MDMIYHAEKQIESLNKRINGNADISLNNKNTIIKFRDECFANNISISRTMRYMYCLRDLSIWLKKDFDACNKEDIKSVIANLEMKSNYSPRTKYEYRATLKKFYKWLRNNDLPDETSWIKLNFKKHNNKLPSEVLNEEDVKRMIDATQSSRDRAIIMTLYESGCRIGEFIKIKIKDIEFEKPGCILIVQGKTGGRRIRVISAEPYLTEWLNRHPDRNNPNSFLWVENNKTDMLEYPALRKALRVAGRRANLQKKVNPHNFRHARATYLANKFTEQQLKVFFGWTRASEMASVYVHLSGKDIDTALLQAYGMQDPHQDKIITNLMPKVCLRCKTQNETSNKFCKLCGTILDKEVIVEYQAKEASNQEVNNVMNLLFKDKEVLALISRKIGEMNTNVC